MHIYDAHPQVSLLYDVPASPRQLCELLELQGSACILD